MVAFVLFHFYGNAARGYIDTNSLFYWWGRQWFDPASETQHGPVVLLLAMGLFARNLRKDSPALKGSKSAPAHQLDGAAKEKADDGLAPSKFAAQGAARSNFELTPDLYRAGGGVMAAALLLHFLAYAMQQTRLSIVALLLFTAGILRLVGGKRWSRAALFPLCLLLLAIPVGFLQPLGFYLRLGVSESAESVLHLFKISVVRNGTQLFAPDGRFQYDVAAACSGVRSLVALLGLSLLVGYLRLPRFWPQVLLVLATIPFAFAGNFLRILAIVIAGQHFGQSGGEWVHDHSGFVVFLVVLGLILAAIPLLARGSGAREGKDAVPRRADRAQAMSVADANVAVRVGRRSIWPVSLAVTLLAGAVVVGIRAIDARPPQPDAGVLLAADGVDPAPLPEFIGTEWIGQRVEVTAAEREVLPPDTGYSRRNYVSIQDRSHQVFVSVVLSGRDRSSIHRPELCLVGQGWNIEERTERILRLGNGEDLPVTLLRIQRELTDRTGDRRSISCWLAYWFVGREVEIPSHAGMIWRSSLDRLLHFRADRWAYVLAQAPLSAGEADGLRQIEEVVGAVWPQVRRGRR